MLDTLQQEAREAAYRLTLQRQRVVVARFCQAAHGWERDARIAEADGGILRRTPAPSGPPSQRMPASPVYYRGCRSDVRWMQAVRSSLCSNGLPRSSSQLSELQAAHIPDKFAFVFDGMAGFNSLQGLRIGASNIDGSEPNDFQGNGLGLALFSQALEQGFGDPREYELHYHLSSGFGQREDTESAVACAGQIQQYVDVTRILGAGPEKVRWIAMGYSNGGDQALAFQERLAAQGTGLDLLATVDPVPQVMGYMVSALHQHAGRRLSYTRRAVNFYQSDDHDSIPLFPLLGKPVDGADRNVLVNAQNDPHMRADGANNHGLIVTSPLVQRGITCELRRLDDPALPACE